LKITYQIPGSAQRSPCELRQAGNGATVATAACVAGKSGVWPGGVQMKKIFVATSLLSVLGLASLTALAQSREALLSQIETKRAELAALEKNFLAPSEADRAQFAEFLR